MSNPGEGIRAAATAIAESLKAQGVDSSVDAEKLARTAVGAWLASMQSVPAAAPSGTKVDWNPDWPAPSGWRVEVYPEMPTERGSGRNDRMNAAARLIKD
jgi:hypothetical protein